MLDVGKLEQELEITLKREHVFTRRHTVPVSQEQKDWLVSLSSRGVEVNKLIRGLLDLARPVIEKRLTEKLGRTSVSKDGSS